MSKLKIYLHNTAYYFTRLLLSPLYLMPYRMIHAIGRSLGNIAYYLAPSRLRKTTTHNLALAQQLNLSEKQIKRIARKSFQNLVIIALEYFRLKGSRKKMDKFVTGTNLGPFHERVKAYQGYVAVTGHIANWELCFIHHTQSYPAYAIGKPIKNGRLYRFIQSIREMHQGKIIEMQKALSQGVKILKQGGGFAMVNDQSFTSSFYSYPFFGARAWTSPSPALLAYRAQVPIFVITTTRFKGGRYEYHLSDPIWPDRKTPLKKEVPRLMNEVMSQFESHISKYPDQWLWQHKRWKQEGFHRVFKAYKADSILFILPQDPHVFKKLNTELDILSQIYRRSFLTFYVPEALKDQLKLKGHEVITYQNTEELFKKDYRFQLIFDFEGVKGLKRHYMKLSAQNLYTLEHLLHKLNLKRESPFTARSLFTQTLCLTDTPFD